MTEAAKSRPQHKSSRGPSGEIRAPNFRSRSDFDFKEVLDARNTGGSPGNLFGLLLLIPATYLTCEGHVGAVDSHGDILSFHIGTPQKGGSDFFLDIDRIDQRLDDELVIDPGYTAQPSNVLFCIDLIKKVLDLPFQRYDCLLYTSGSNC